MTWRRCWGMLVGVDALLHRIEALPGDGRYAVTFRMRDDSEVTAVVHAADGEISVAAASLPNGWSTGSPSALALEGAVLALDHARALGPARALLLDVPGGWDVSLGNVTLSEDGVPACGAHGQMRLTSPGKYQCVDCGAQARYADALRRQE